MALELSCVSVSLQKRLSKLLGYSANSYSGIRSIERDSKVFLHGLGLRGKRRSQQRLLNWE